MEESKPNKISQNQNVTPTKDTDLPKQPLVDDQSNSGGSKNTVKKLIKNKKIIIPLVIAVVLLVGLAVALVIKSHSPYRFTGMDDCIIHFRGEGMAEQAASDKCKQMEAANRKQPSKPAANNQPAPANDTQASTIPWTSGCSNKQRVAMAHMPMDMNDVSTITPIGLTAGAHVTPIDHLYFFPKDMTHRDAAPVYAMADGYIVDISKREVNVNDGTSRPAEWRVAIQHSCQTVTYFDLMTSLDPKIKAEYDKAHNSQLRIPVKAGQEVGRVGAQSLDTAVYNFGMTLPGFIHPDKYKGELWKVHTDDFF